jgi:hypothetical protein
MNIEQQSPSGISIGFQIRSCDRALANSKLKRRSGLMESSDRALSPNQFHIYTQI